MAKPKRIDFTGRAALLKGDTWAFADSAVTFTDGRTLSTPGVVLRSSIKRFLNLEDPANVDPLVDAAAGVLQVDTDDRGGIEILSGTSYRVAFPAEQTELLATGRYHYDVVIDFSATESYTLVHGEIECIEDVTDSRVA